MIAPGALGTSEFLFEIPSVLDCRLDAANIERPGRLGSLEWHHLILHKIQQATIDRVMFAPLMDLRTLNGMGPRLADNTMNVIPLYPFPAYEDIRLKNP